jgi:tetratricopeptide (TPR) repeat protein
MELSALCHIAIALARVGKTRSAERLAGRVSQIIVRTGDLYTRAVILSELGAAELLIGSPMSQSRFRAAIAAAEELGGRSGAHALAQITRAAASVKARNAELLVHLAAARHQDWYYAVAVVQDAEVKSGHLSAAIDAAESLDSGLYRVKYLVRLVDKLTGNRGALRAQDLILAAAEHELDNIPNQDCTKVYLELAAAYATLGREQDAARIVRRAMSLSTELASRYERVKVCSEAGRILAWVGNEKQARDALGLALQLILEPADESYRVEALVEVAKSQDRTGDRVGAGKTLATASTATALLNGAWARAEGLRSVAEAQAETGASDEAAQSFALARENAKQAGDYSGLALRSVAAAQARAGLTDEALIILKELPGAGERLEGLVQLVNTGTATNRMIQTLKLAIESFGIAGDWNHIHILRACAAATANAGARSLSRLALARALRSARKLNQPPRELAKAVLTIAATAASVSERATAQRLYSTALILSSPFLPEPHSVQALTALAKRGCCRPNRIFTSALPRGPGECCLHF